MSANVERELDFTDTCKWSADGWCFTHSTEAGPVYCRRPTDAETTCDDPAECDDPECYSFGITRI